MARRFKQAKSTCEIALVLCLIRAKLDVAARKMETQRKRNLRSCGKRNLMRKVWMARNTKAGVMTDLEWGASLRAERSKPGAV